MAAPPSGYDGVRAFVSASGADSRVEVNQRALIDKILARYASPGAVYRELLQNSNDAGAQAAEIRFTTAVVGEARLVSEVVYRNNGIPFRAQDWHRLKKIAEGNPAADKVGFFGVGAYAMFSICEAPMVVSGREALVFVWRKDALWTKVGASPLPESEWTSFVLPARDPYPLPDVAELGAFLCGNLTFLASLAKLSVFVDDRQVLAISRRVVRPPVTVHAPRASSWWARDGAVLSSPEGVFRLADEEGALTESIIALRADVDGRHAEVQTSLFSSKANVHMGADMRRRIERVTKKAPPESVNIQIVIGGNSESADEGETGSEVSFEASRKAKAIVDSFAPRMGTGKVFIGFKTSQSTGLGVHLAAPLIPTVEREAIDLADPTLNKYNGDLLFIGGLLMRLGLEHVMTRIGNDWESEKEEREYIKADFEAKKASSKGKHSSEASKKQSAENPAKPKTNGEDSDSNRRGGLLGFARFMAKRIADVVPFADLFSEEQDEDVLNPVDNIPLSKAELAAAMIMRCFSPQKSTPDSRVGALIAGGFEGCLPRQAPPVLTQTGIERGNDARLPFLGIESFTTEKVVRSIVLKNAETYLLHVAQVRPLRLEDLVRDLSQHVMEQEELVRLLVWWNRFSRQAITPGQLQSSSSSLKNSIRFRIEDESPTRPAENRAPIFALRNFPFYTSEKHVPYSLPLPDTVLPPDLLKSVPVHVLENDALVYWFEPLPFPNWANFIVGHDCMTKGLVSHNDMRMSVLAHLSKEYGKAREASQRELANMLKSSFGNLPCIPYDNANGQLTYVATDLYIPSAELEFFSGVDLHKVSKGVSTHGVTESFLLAMGVRETVSMDVLFTQLDNLKWNRNPKPLIQFLRKSNLKETDLAKLRTTKYLPAANESTELYTPHDLCLPTRETVELGFVRVLQWPAEDDLREHSADGKFLLRLGCKPLPRLALLLRKATEARSPENDLARNKILDFVNSNVGYRGKYRTGNFLSAAKQFSFLPTESRKPYQELVPGLCTIDQCYLDPSCVVLGFAVVEKRHKILAERFEVPSHPSWDLCIQYLLQTVTLTNNRMRSVDDTSKAAEVAKVKSLFWNAFAFLSSKVSTLSEKNQAKLKSTAFIPVASIAENGQVSLVWRKPEDVFFKRSSSETVGSDLVALFDLVDGSPFLRHVGVKNEPGPVEICRLLTDKSAFVFKKCGETTYKSLLKRLASHFESLPNDVVNRMKSSKCLLAVRFDDDKRLQTEMEINHGTENGSDEGIRNQSMIVTLERARDVCVVDDAFLQRLFNPLCAPNESDLEDLYRKLGSVFVSKLVTKEHDVGSDLILDTEATAELLKRLQERAPLLIAPSVTHRPFVRGAEKILDPNSIEVIEVARITSISTFRQERKARDVTCCSTGTVAKKSFNVAPGSRKPSPKKKTWIFITPKFDIFDVGATLGDLILKRVHLDDAFLFGTLLQAPLSQLRARGFPVDRVLRTRADVKSPEPASRAGPASSPPKSPVGANSSAPSSGQKPPEAKSTLSQDEGLFQILRNKFPDADPATIQRLLRADRSPDRLLNVSKVLENAENAKKDPQMTRGPQMTRTTSSSSGKGLKDVRALTQAMRNKGAGILSKAMGGVLRAGASDVAFSQGSRKPSSSQARTKPENVAGNQSNLEHLLQQSVKSCNPVPRTGLSSSTTTIQSPPENEPSETCEVIEGQNLVPSPGPRNASKTRNGILVFAARENPESITFLRIGLNWEAIERFSRVIEELAHVFSLELKTLAIYWDNQGSTIAFNAGRALHFNARYFCQLHDSNAPERDINAMSYWFVIICHELAHNFRSDHGKEHGFFAESYCQFYQPILFSRMAALGVVKQ